MCRSSTFAAQCQFITFVRCISHPLNSATAPCTPQDNRLLSSSYFPFAWVQLVRNSIMLCVCVCQQFATIRSTSAAGAIIALSQQGSSKRCERSRALHAKQRHYYFSAPQSHAITASVSAGWPPYQEIVSAFKRPAMPQCLDEPPQPFFSACAVTSLEIFDPCLATLSGEGRVNASMLPPRQMSTGLSSP